MTKLGFHIRVSNRFDVDAALLDAKPAGITAVVVDKDIPWLAGMVTALPGTTFIARHIGLEPQLEAAKGKDDPVTTANWWADQIIAICNMYPVLKRCKWQDFNEPKDDDKWYDTFIAQATRRLCNLGIGKANFTFSTGRPEPTDWSKYDISIQITAAFEGLAVVNFHEYGIGGSMIAQLGYRCGRYKQFDAYTDSRGLKRLKKTISEGGYDDPGFWDTGVTEEAYAADVIGIMQRLYDLDPTIICYDLYSLDPTDGAYAIQKTYTDKRGEHNPFFQRMIDFIKSTQGAVQPPVQPPVVTPPQGGVDTLPAVTTDNVNLRSSPSSADKSNIIIVLPKGTKFEMEGASNGWVKVSAYISSSYVKGG